MRESQRNYHRLMVDIYDRIIEDEGNREALTAAGTLIAEAVCVDKLIYLSGPGGHSNMSTEECLCRAGMLVQLSPMIDGTSLLHGTTKTRYLQRAAGYAKGLLEEYGVQKNDVLIVVNAYGINYMTVDMALEARKMGLHVIGIGSRSFGQAIAKDHPARHANGKNLEDVCDIFIDCKMPLGDAVIEIGGCEQKAGPTSTLCNIFTIHLLMLEAVEQVAEAGVTPKIWRSINMPGGDAYNTGYFKEYGQRIKYLL